MAGTSPSISSPKNSSQIPIGKCSATLGKKPQQHACPASDLHFVLSTKTSHHPSGASPCLLHGPICCHESDNTGNNNNNVHISTYKSSPRGGLKGQLPHAGQAWMGLKAAVSDPAEGQRAPSAAQTLPVFTGTSGEGGTEGGKASREPGAALLSPLARFPERQRKQGLHICCYCSQSPPSTPAHLGEARPVGGDKPARTRFFCHD